jgi:hypothetical protein
MRGGRDVYCFAFSKTPLKLGLAQLGGVQPPYRSPARFLPSIITLRKIRLIRVW